jgi:hypothetical protein
MTEKNRNNVGRAVSASEDFCKKWENSAGLKAEEEDC